MTLLAIILFFVIWNADFTNYTKLQDISRTSEGGRTGLIEWEVYEHTERYSEVLLFDSMWESIQTAAAPVTDAYERLTGRSREWFKLSVESHGDQLRIEDIENLPINIIDHFQTNGALVTVETAKSLSKLRYCQALEISRIDDNPATIDHLTRIPELNELIVSPETFTNPSGTLKRFKGLKSITVKGRSKNVTKALVSEIASYPMIEVAAFQDCKFEPGAIQALNGSTSIQSLDINNSDDIDNFSQLDVKQMLRLRNLRLTRLKIAPSWINSLAGSQISDLDIAEMEISGCLSSVINQLPNIKGLGLVSVSGSCISLAEIDPQCPIETFYGSELKLDFSSFQRIATLPRIEIMLIDKWNLPASDFLNFRPSPSLQTLDISKTGISPEVQKTFYEKHPSINQGFRCMFAPE